jgi:putative DNA primase/helicase
MLLAGDTMISFDNCDSGLGGVFLCQCLTQRVVKPRVLGKSLTPNVLSNAAIFATGNNLTFAGDLIRRALMSTLDPECEKPENREFATEDPILILRRDRPKYVALALTMLRAFFCAGSPRPDGTASLGSFEAWSEMVRFCLIWLGEADPCETMEKVRRSDPILGTLAAVLDQWHCTIGPSLTNVNKVIAKACEQQDAYNGSSQFLHPGLRDALLVVADDRGTINSKRLGKWLSKNQGRVANHKRIVAGGLCDGVTMWKLDVLE